MPDTGTPWLGGRKRTALSTSLLISKCIKEVATCVPSVIGLQALAGVAVVILETADGVVSNREDCVNLAERVAQIVLSVSSEFEQATPPSERRGLASKVEKLSEILQEVQQFVAKHSKVHWMRRLIHQREIQQAITDFHRRLDDVCRIFELTALVGIHHIVLEILDVQSKNFSAVTEGDFRLFLRHEVTLLREIRKQSHGVQIYQGQVEGRVAPVVVKRFVGEQALATKVFLRDLHMWRKLWHPNLLHLIGYSKYRDPPFIVMAFAKSRHVGMFMAESLRNSPIQSHITGLRLMRDIVAAVLHIEENHMLECMSPEFLDVSNIWLDSSGRAVIFDLCFDDEGLKPLVQYDINTGLMQAWRRTCRQILYGNDIFLHYYPALRLERPGTHRNAGYMAMVMGFVHYTLNLGPAAALARFDVVLETFSVYERPSLLPEDVVDFQLALLEHGFLPGRFSMSFEVEEEYQDQFHLGDIGYLVGDVDDPHFVRLCNVHEKLGEVCDFGRHTIPQTEIDFDTEYLHYWRNELYVDSSRSWKFMLMNVCSIATNYRVLPDQLILITGITERPLSRFIVSPGQSPASILTRLDEYDIAHYGIAYYSRYVGEEAEHSSTSRVALDPGASLGERRLRQRLWWMHLGAHQCVDLGMSDFATETRENVIPGAFLEEWC